MFRFVSTQVLNMQVLITTQFTITQARAILQSLHTKVLHAFFYNLHCTRTFLPRKMRAIALLLTVGTATNACTTAAFFMPNAASIYASRMHRRTMGFSYARDLRNAKAIADARGDPTALALVSMPRDGAMHMFLCTQDHDEHVIKACVWSPGIGLLDMVHTMLEVRAWHAATFVSCRLVAGEDLGKENTVSWTAAVSLEERRRRRG